MTHINDKQSGSLQTQATAAADLVSAIKKHRQAELVSFHTPGHRGYASAADALTDDFQSNHRLARKAELESTPWMFDVTELPGLDELADPTGVLAAVEQRASAIWQSENSYVSVNGASACVIAAICACASRGKKALIPRNAHRSVINALIISGLTPVWYQTHWDHDWDYWGASDLESFQSELEQHKDNLACALVVSPNYGGTFSDIATISSLCQESGNIPLIVDEAHGTHLVPGTDMPPSAVSLGASLVIHSLHKTVTALTQTGLLHRMPGCPVSDADLRAQLNLVQSSSPSYLLMSSIEQTLVALEGTSYLSRIEAASRSVRLWLNQSFKKQSLDPAHLLIRLPGMTATELYQRCTEKGIYPECVLGRGVLFLLSPHTTPDHMDYLLSALSKIADQFKPNPTDVGELDAESAGTITVEFPSIEQPQLGEQVISPREAFFSQCESVPLQKAVGRIAGECLAPCPPGTPVLIPGQRVTKEILSLCGTKSQLRVVMEVDTRIPDQQTCKQSPRKRSRTSETRPTQGEY